MNEQKIWINLRFLEGWNVSFLCPGQVISTNSFVYSRVNDWPKAQSDLMLRRLLRKTDVLLPYKKYWESGDAPFSGVKESVSGSLGNVGHFGRWFHLGDDGHEREEQLLLCVCGILGV